VVTIVQKSLQLSVRPKITQEEVLISRWRDN